MNPSMDFQLKRFFKRFSTHIALVRFLTSMNSSMDFQITCFCKRFFTHIALVRFFSSVYLLVIF
uniref:Uncharacterized protein n=1 Tax=Ciona savignyi TaxID=51511 RepID=H2YRL8_CIOSA